MLHLGGAYLPPFPVHRNMEPLREPSIGEILDRLLADRLIDACHMTSDYVTIVQGTKRHSFAYRRARTFLSGMLRGRSWNTEPAADLPTSAVPPLRAIAKSRTEEVSASVEPALEELLRIAADMRIIEGHARGTAERSVKIALSACETEMREPEAVAFLAECILYKLNELRRARDTAAGWEGGDGAWSPSVGRTE